VSLIMFGSGGGLILSSAAALVPCMLCGPASCCMLLHVVAFQSSELISLAYSVRDN